MNNVLLQNPETEVLHFNSLNGGEGTYSYWKVFQYMYEGSYSLRSTETLDGTVVSENSKSLQNTESAFQNTESAFQKMSQNF